MKRSQAGFTLTEMLVTLAMAGVMTAVAVPNFSQMREGYRLRNATYDVFAALQRARSEAVKRNNNYRFSLLNSTTYKLHDDADSDGVVDPGETVTKKDISFDAPGVQLYFSGWSWNGSGWVWGEPLKFGPDGTTGRGDWMWLTVDKPGVGSKVILVSPTGRIKIL